LAELKLKGGMEYFKTGERNLNALSIEEWIEFFTLTGQMDGVLWALQPNDPDKIASYYENVKELMASLESEIDAVKELTGKTSLPKGRA